MQKTANPSFESFSFGSGLLYEDKTGEHPTRLWSWQTGSQRFKPKGSSFFVYVYKGIATVEFLENKEKGLPYYKIDLHPGMYFSTSRTFEISKGMGIVIESGNYDALLNIGGPVEDDGRLLYIDGCTDSLLVPPVKLGNPCLNLLCFPEQINQTPHTHPSIRVGVIASGEGWCVTPWGEIELKPGTIFVIKPGGKEVTHDKVKAIEGTHSFRTEKGKTMRVIAYHPDSDYGPQDEDHPMLNRTIVDGKSAKEIKAIRTSEKGKSYGEEAPKKPETKAKEEPTKEPIVEEKQEEITKVEGADAQADSK